MSKKKLKTFAVPVVWSMIGNVFVSAYSKEEALKYVKENIQDLELPIDYGPEASYLEDSFQLSADDDDEMMDLIDERRVLKERRINYNDEFCSSVVIGKYQLQ